MKRLVTLMTAATLILSMAAANADYKSPACLTGPAAAPSEVVAEISVLGAVSDGSIRVYGECVAADGTTLRIAVNIRPETRDWIRDQAIYLYTHPWP